MTVVFALIALNLMVFGLETRAADPARFIDLFALVPYNVIHGIVLPTPSPPWPPLTLLTAPFLHGSVLHVGSNMLVLLIAGPPIAYLCGAQRFALFYLLCGVAGGLAQVAAGPDSHVPEIGASGAIAGVLGAYIVSLPQRLGAFALIGAWAVLQFVHGFGTVSTGIAGEQGGIAYFAHIGGFCCGVLAIGLFRIYGPKTRGAGPPNA